MEKIVKQDNKVMQALELKVIRRLVCKTDKGELELVLRKGETKYFLTLDSVPLPRETNDELMNLLFQKEIQQVNKTTEDFKKEQEIKVNKEIKDILAPKKMGRPKKVVTPITNTPEVKLDVTTNSPTQAV